MGKYLIIGGTGGIGRMLANRLVMKYHKVSARSAEGEAEGEGRRELEASGCMGGQGRWMSRRVRECSKLWKRWGSTERISASVDLVKRRWGTRASLLALPGSALRRPLLLLTN